MISKKPYTKPEITRIALDTSIVLMQLSNPEPQGNGSKGGSKGTDQPFQSPFGDKPFG
jgi:hypothetical protein